MAGKKDKSVVAVISGLTDSQAARISADIMKSKQRNAPNGRGTVASGFTSSVGSLLQKGTKRVVSETHPQNEKTLVAKL